MSQPTAFTKMRANRRHWEAPMARLQRLQDEIDRIEEGFEAEWRAEHSAHRADSVIPMPRRRSGLFWWLRNAE